MSEPSPPPHPSFAQALRFWLRLGFISFGGPAGQIALMQRELVEQRRWISQARFNHALNYCMLLPGPEAQQLATYIGWLLHGTRGGVAAGVLFVLPSLVLLIALSWVYVVHGQVPWIAALFWGLKAAVAAIVLQALHRVALRSLPPWRTHRLPWLLALASFVALALLRVPFPAVVLGALALGGYSAWRQRHWFASGQAHGSAAAGDAGALIGNGMAPPAHAQPSRGRLARVLAVGALLWLLPMAALLALFGLHGTLSRMALFFSQAALVTFGGAYAVLPYVHQAAVLQHQWLSAAQMMDGLALGETTPGPLIMIVAFVGYLGAWKAQVLGAGLEPWGAALGACVATWFTFLPSFIFILAGGPWVEATRGRLGFTEPLAAVTCAVVGVVGSLALLFIGALAWPAGRGGPLDVAALVLAAAAAFALVRLRQGVIPVLLACALAGLLWQTLRPLLMG